MLELLLLILTSAIEATVAWLVVRWLDEHLK